MEDSPFSAPVSTVMTPMHPAAPTSPFAGGTDPVAELQAEEAERERQRQIIKKAAAEKRRLDKQRRKVDREAERQRQLKAEQDALAAKYADVDAWGMF